MEEIGAPNNKAGQRQSNKHILIWFVKVLVVTALLTIMIRFLLYQDSHYAKYVNPDSKQKIDSLNRVIQNQEVNISRYKTEILTLESQNQQLEAEKQANNEKIKKIKTEYEKKSAAVANYDAGSLDSFFRNRYE